MKNLYLLGFQNIDEPRFSRIENHSVSRVTEFPELPSTL